MYFKFSILSTVSQVKDIEKDWVALAEKASANFYQESSWYLSLKTSLIPDIQFIIGKNENDLVLVLPVVYDQKSKVLSLPVCYQTDIIDCILDKERATSSFFSELTAFINYSYPKWKKIENARLLSDSHCWYLFDKLRLKSHFDAFSKNSFFPTLKEGIQESRAPSQFKHARRHERKLLKNSQNLQIRYLKPSIKSVEKFFSLENASWKGAIGKNTSILSSPETLEFYQAITENFIRGNKLRIFGCESDGRLIAAKLGVMSKDCLFLLKTAYLPDYAKYSVGNILIANLIHQAEADPELNEINLVTGPTWADRWVPEQHALYWGTIYRASLGGYLSLIKQCFKDILRPAKYVIQNIYAKLYSNLRASLKSLFKLLRNVFW